MSSGRFATSGINAKKWNADPNRIALVGGSAGGYLSNMVGVLDASGIKGAKDPVDRTSARVQAVVTLFGPSDFRGQTPSEGVKKLLGPLIEQKGLEAALAEASPVTHFNSMPPPFLLIHGDRDESVPLMQSTHLQAALKANGVRCDLIVIPNGPHATGKWHKVPGVPDWEKQMTEWLNEALGSPRPGRRRHSPKNAAAPDDDRWLLSAVKGSLPCPRTTPRYPL